MTTKVSSSRRKILRKWRQRLRGLRLSGVARRDWRADEVKRLRVRYTYEALHDLETLSDMVDRQQDLIARIRAENE